MSTLTTPRLKLRPFEETDLDALAGLMANGDFMRFSLGPLSQAKTSEISRKNEIAYRFHRDHWRQGVATEAARAVRDYAFQVLKLSHVISLIHPDNIASERVAEKNGMTVEKQTVFRGFPTPVYAIDREQWENSQARPIDAVR